MQRRCQRRLNGTKISGAMTYRPIVLAVLLMAISGSALAQDDEPGRRPARRPDGPWFGFTLPPAPGKDPAVVVGDRAPRPVAMAPDAQSPELTAAVIRADLTTI